MLPGGVRGAERLSAHKPLIQWLKAQRAAGKMIAALCAAPAIVLHTHALLPLPFPRYTCHPSVASHINGGGADAHTLSTGPRVVYDASSNTVTGIGMGAALEFATEIAIHARGSEWVIENIMKGITPGFSLPIAHRVGQSQESSRL